MFPLYKGGLSVLVAETIYKTNGLGTTAKKSREGGQIPVISRNFFCIYTFLICTKILGNVIVFIYVSAICFEFNFIHSLVEWALFTIVYGGQFLFDGTL